MIWHVMKALSMRCYRGAGAANSTPIAANITRSASKSMGAVPTVCVVRGAGEGSAAGRGGVGDGAAAICHVSVPGGTGPAKFIMAGCTTS